jgi:hypothetical protein
LNWVVTAGKTPCHATLPTMPTSCFPGEIVDCIQILCQYRGKRTARRAANDRFLHAKR